MALYVLPWIKCSSLDRNTCSLQLLELLPHTAYRHRPCSHIASHGPNLRARAAIQTVIPRTLRGLRTSHERSSFSAGISIAHSLSRLIAVVQSISSSVSPRRKTISVSSCDACSHRILNAESTTILSAPGRHTRPASGKSVSSCVERICANSYCLGYRYRSNPYGT